MAAPHEKLTAGSQRGADKAAQHLDALTKAYGRALRAAGRRAATRFRQTETITAASNPKGPPDWTPPPTGSILDQQELAADTQRKTAKLHRQMLAASAGEALAPFGINFDIAAPTSVALLDAVAQRIQAGIAAAIQEQITEAIVAGYAAGQSVQQVSSAIQTATDLISRPRADMLARTDLNALSNGGSLLAASVSGAASTKTWLATDDERTRETHADADGQTVAIDDVFDVGGEDAQYPGDPQLSDEEAANCRCTLVYGQPLTASAGPRKAAPGDFASWRDHQWEGAMSEPGSSAAGVDGAAGTDGGHHESVGERQGRQPGSLIADGGPDVSNLAMVAVYPQPSEAEAISLDGGHPSEKMHVTLVFLGEADSFDVEDVRQALAAVAEDTVPLAGTVGGVGRFARGPDGAPLIALPDVKDLSGLREAVASALADRGIESPSEHGWTPHLTLDYTQDGAMPPIDCLGKPLTFTTLSLTIADVRQDFPLAGQAETSPARSGVLYLARHGLTEYDSDDHASDTIRGWADDPLNDAGVAEAERLAANLVGLGIESIQASDLQRALETADIIAAQLAPIPEATNALRPWNLGDLQGRTSEDAADEIASYVDAPDTCVPGGESFNDFCGRFLPAVADAMAATEQGATTLLVTHSHNLKLARAWIQNGRQPVSGAEFMQDAPGPASVLACDPAQAWSVTEILCDGSPLEPAGMIPPEVHYRPSDDPERECGACDFQSAGHCTMFRGNPAVIADYVCDEFVARAPTTAVTSGGTMSDLLNGTFDIAQLSAEQRSELRALLDTPPSALTLKLNAARAFLIEHDAEAAFGDDELRAVILTLEALGFAAPSKHRYAGSGGDCKICGYAPSNKTYHYAAETVTLELEDFALLAASTDGTPWTATLCIADQPTVDSGIKRLLVQDGGSWRPLPLPLALLDDSPHADMTSKAPMCGRIDQIWWAGNVCQASGVFFDASDDAKVAEAGSKAAALVSEMRRLGISVDLVDCEVELCAWNGSSVSSLDEANDPTAGEMDDANAPGGPATEANLPNDIPDMDEVEEPEEVEYIMAFSQWCIAGATICPVQALTDATISLVASAIGRVGEWRSVADFAIPALTAAAAGLVPLEPPAAWFADPQLDGPTPLTITDDGRVFGHLAAWDTCHTGRPGCTPPPHSPTGYMNFHLGEIKTAEGDRVAVGTLTFDAPHATLPMSASQAVRHYDDTATSGAHVRAGEDQWGIWLAGALNPRISAEEARTLMAAPPSGDWRQVQRGQGIDLVGAHAVNQPGFIVHRKGLSLAASGECEPCEESFARELAVLAASADGIEGLAALVEA